MDRSQLIKENPVSPGEGNRFTRAWLQYEKWITNSKISQYK